MNGGVRQRTDGYYARLTVPEELRASIGKREFQAKLPEARNKAHAERLATPHHAKWNEIITLARAGEYPPLPFDELEGIAAQFRQWAAIYHWFPDRLLEAGELDVRLRRFLDLRLKGHLVDIPPEPAIRLNGGHHKALLRLLREQTAASVPPKSFATTAVASTLIVTYTWDQLIRDWAKDTGKITRDQPDPEKHKTCYSWKRIVAKLTNLLGHDNAAIVTQGDRIKWKDSLVDAGVHPITIGNHLTVAQTLLNWAYANKRIPSKPEPVIYKAKRPQGTKKLGYPDDVARTILLSARNQTNPKDLHKRWCPWLAAFNGARIAEIAGAMVADVVRIQGISCLHFRVDNRAIEIKNEGSERIIPIHSAVIAEGFLDYVSTLDPKGPLFPNVKPDRFGNRGGNAAKTIGAWIRKDLGITNKRYSPSHSWRHRLESEHRALNIREDITDAITGHHDGEAATNYGEFYVKETLYPAIERLRSPLSAV